MMFLNLNLITALLLGLGLLLVVMNLLARKNLLKSLVPVFILNHILLKLITMLLKIKLTLTMQRNMRNFLNVAVRNVRLLQLLEKFQLLSIICLKLVKFRILLIQLLLKHLLKIELNIPKIISINHLNNYYLWALHRKN